MSRRTQTQDVERELRTLSAELSEERPALARRLESAADRLREQVAPEPAGYVTTGEAAAALGVSPNTVKKWVRTGIIRDVWALPGSGYLKIAHGEVDRIRTAGTPARTAEGED